MTAGIVLGTVAALLFALSAFIQQHATHKAVAPADAHVLRHSSGVRDLVTSLVRSKTWLVGWVTNVAGVGAQAAALKSGSVAGVQPLMSAQLLFVVLLASARQRKWPTIWDWLFAVAVCAGVVLLLTSGRAVGVTGPPDRVHVLVITGGVALIAVTMRQLSRRATPWVASLMVGVAAGLCHAMTAVFLQTTVTDLFARGLLATLLSWPIYGLLASTVSGLLLAQIAFATGPLPPAVAAMSSTNPVASFVIGLLISDTEVHLTGVTVAAIVASAALIIGGIAGLANSSSTRGLYGSAGPSPSPAKTRG
ncbi:MAG: DMT family transporter [Mycobacterium sp.]